MVGYYPKRMLYVSIWNFCSSFELAYSDIITKRGVLCMVHPTVISVPLFLLKHYTKLHYTIILSSNRCQTVCSWNRVPQQKGHGCCRFVSTIIAPQLEFQDHEANMKKHIMQLLIRAMAHDFHYSSITYLARYCSVCQCYNWRDIAQFVWLCKQ